MAHFDLPLDELRAYRPDRTEPPDLDAFWQQTLAEARAAASPPVLEPVDTGLVTVDVRDLTFAGFAASRCAAGWSVPRAVERTAALRGRVHRLRRRARPAARVAAVGAAGLRAPGDGHPRPGQQLAQPVRPPDPDTGGPGSTRLPHPRHRRPGRLLLPAAVHRRRARGRRRPRARRRSTPTASSWPAAARAAASPSPQPALRRRGRRRPGRRAVPVRHPPGDRDHRRRPVRASWSTYCATHRDQVDAGVRDALATSTACNLAPRAHRAGAVLGRR